MVRHLIPTMTLAVLALGLAGPAMAQTPAATPSAAIQPAMSPALTAVFQAHAAAVAARDLTALEPTLTAGPSLTLIFPNGRRTDTREAFLQFHREWFAETNWTMRFTPVSVRETADMAVVLVQTRYEETGADGALSWSESWLTLTFAKEPHGWALIHDQNTRIRTSADPVT